MGKDTFLMCSIGNNFLPSIMDFELKTLTLADICSEKCDALIALIPNDFVPGLSVIAAHALHSGDFESKPGRLLGAYRAEGLLASRVVLVGVGDGSPKNVRTAVTAALGALKGSNAQVAVLYLGAVGGSSVDVVRTAVVACGDASYAYSTTKSKNTPEKLKRVVVGVSDSSYEKSGFFRAAAVVKGIDFAKEWANRPANHATPAKLANAAKELGKLPNIKVEVLGPKEVEKLEMGAFMAVAQGSAEPLRFIVLRYSGALSSEAPFVLVGKGITFDTGGISIKPAAEMDEMKFDMCGAASVLGTLRAIAELKPKLNLVCIIPSCENMPAGNAVKPGDVVTSMSGQTIEVINTDAEGRLVLCDLMTWTQANVKPKVMIDLATLTGAMVVSLGHEMAGMFANDDGLAEQLLAAAKSSTDALWRQPLGEAYDRLIDSPIADMKNVGPREAGSITAAQFLQRFVDDGVKWAHLDIAGMAWSDKPKPTYDRGATGYGVRLLDKFIEDTAEG